MLAYFSPLSSRISTTYIPSSHRSHGSLSEARGMARSDRMGLHACRCFPWRPLSNPSGLATLELPLYISALTITSR